jgi:hypothetical protein
MPTAGGVIGNSLAGALSRWIGAGDYSINNNSIVQKSLKAASSIPLMHVDSQSIVVRHKEYLGEVKSSQGFAVQQSYPLNPGMSTTFPWLSGIAVKFQEYKIRGLVFHYIPTSGSAVSSTNAALGSVMLQTSYRATDALPGSKVEILNEYCSNEVVPCDSMAHPIECDPKENPFNVQYVRSRSVPAGETQLMYDLGITHLAVAGSQSATPVVLGDLWVTYEIELKKPILASNVTSDISSGNAVITTGLSAASYYGSGTTTLSGPTPITVTGNTMTFPKGCVGVFQIVVWIDAPSLSSTAASMTYVNCREFRPVVDDSAITYYATNVSTVVFMTSIMIFDPSVVASVSTPLVASGAINRTRVTVTEVQGLPS